MSGALSTNSLKTSLTSDPPEDPRPHTACAGSSHQGIYGKELRRIEKGLAMQLGVVGLGRNEARLIGHAVDTLLEIAVSNVASKDRDVCMRAYRSNGAEAAGPAQAPLQRFIEEQHGILLNEVMVRGIA
jgi:hypothetical protein